MILSLMGQIFVGIFLSAIATFLVIALIDAFRWNR